MKKPARIDVKYKVLDTRAEVKKRYFESLGFGKKIKSVFLADSYIVDSGLRLGDLRKAAVLFENSLVEKTTINKPKGPKHFDWAIEIGYLPGVTDNIGATAKEMIEDFTNRKFKNGEGVYSSQIIFISGQLSRNNVEVIAGNLYNPLIQRINIKSSIEFRRNKGMGTDIPQVHLSYPRLTQKVDLELEDEELSRIGKEGIIGSDGNRRGPLALDIASMKTIRNYFRGKKRQPTDIELESIAQTWSEHCKHTIFADPIDEVKDGLYKTYIQAATNTIRAKKGKKDFCVSVFSDNSGAITFDNNYLVTHKVETHNTPSALDPFGGSVTGIVGVNRDTIGFGLGAKPIANIYGFCFADPRDKTNLYRDADKKEKMMSARKIMEGVVQGVNVGGNCSGIPTPQGFVLFDKRYRGKPLVFVGTVGLIPRKIGGKPSYRKKAKAGDYIVMIGGRVGQDGIHGATFSSEAMNPGSPATAVQIGDPVTQKKFSDAIIREARGQMLYTSITDNGAGGLSCSVAEMAKECNGCRVDLDNVPLKYPGLEPWKIWISESQERMTLAVPKKNWRRFKTLMDSRGVEATILGKFTASGKCVVRYRGKTIMDIELDFLHNGRPKKRLATIPPISHKTASLPKNINIATALREMLKRPNIASFEFIARQYDHEVQAGSVLKPLQGKGRINADVAVQSPLFDSNRGIVLSSGITPSYSEIDSYRMAACAIDSAIRPAIAAGAGLEHMALLDNFCWCSSNEPQRLFQLKRAVQACYDYATAYGTPFISGKDSMFNDFKGYDEKGNSIKISVPPTLLISVIGIVPDVEKTVSLDLKNEGDILYVLGDTYDELGGSEYSQFLSDRNKRVYTGGRVPSVDAKKNIKLYLAFTAAVRKNFVASAISVGKGGLAVAFARTAMAGKLGIDIALKKLRGKFPDDATAIFSESQGRIIVGVAEANLKKFEKMMHGNSFARVGMVTKKNAIVLRGKRKKITVSVPGALKAYRSTFKNY